MGSIRFHGLLSRVLVWSRHWSVCWKIISCPYISKRRSLRFSHLEVNLHVKPSCKIILQTASASLHLFPLTSIESSSESECESDEDSTCSSSSDSEVFDVIAEIKRKKAHPDRLHDELWYNDPGQVRRLLCSCCEGCTPTHHIYDCRLRRCMVAGIETEFYSQGWASSFTAYFFSASAPKPKHQSKCSLNHI